MSLWSIFPATATAETVVTRDSLCLPYPLVAAELAGSWGEALAETHALDGATHVEIWREPAGRSWSVMLVVMPEGAACLVGSGGATKPPAGNPS